MTVVDELIERNAGFAADAFVPGLRINPSRSLMVIGCVDPRVDPAAVLGLRPGEAAVIRNVGGRITPATLRTLELLDKVGAANRPAEPPTEAFNLVILHHTRCGINDLAAFPGPLGTYFDIDEDSLPGKAVTDPIQSVQVDVAVITQSRRGSGHVTGLVYDVDTGLVRTVVAPTPLVPPD